MRTDKADGEGGPARARTPWSRLLGVGLALAIGLGCGLAFKKSLQHPGSAPQPAAPVLQAWLVIGSAEHVLNDSRVALPNGSRFQIKLRSSQAGELALFTVSPAGTAGTEALWRGPVQAQGEAVTPMLRLAGVKGLETLQVELNAGAVGAATTKVQWHLWNF